MNLPEEFINKTKALMGDELYAVLHKGLTEDTPPVSIRLNPFKPVLMPTVEELKDGRVLWSRDGIYLRHRPAFTFDPLLHAGAYYVQEASSMFIQQVLKGREERKEKSPLLVLDLCSAPGGKSTAVRAMLPEGSLLICNEPVRQRAQILAENISKFGHPDVIVTNNYARDIASTGLMFDIIICDVPCSGEGMFRKDEGAIGEWSEDNVRKCQQLQHEIVSDIWPCLRPGGLLIYSTCTFNAHENEENVAWIATELGAEFMEVPTEEGWNITGALVGDRPVYRFLPGKTRGEGLFMAVLQKVEGGYWREEREERMAEKASGTGKTKDEKRKKRDKDVVVSDVNKQTSTWLTDGDKFRILQEKDRITAIPKTWEHIYNKVRGLLKIVHAGIPLGTVKGKDIIPCQSLALSTVLHREAFPCIDLDCDTAIAYLRREAITLPSSTPRGIVLLTYSGLPLGFAKNLGNRANNLYPQEWRIRSSLR